MLYVLALALALVDGASALQSPCSMSRLSLSRVAGALDRVAHAAAIKA